MAGSQTWRKCLKRFWHRLHPAARAATGYTESAYLASMRPGNAGTALSVRQTMLKSPPKPGGSVIVEAGPEAKAMGLWTLTQLAAGTDQTERKIITYQI